VDLRGAVVVRPSQWRIMPWKNGGGTTAEIAARVRPGVEGFDWRLSLATVESAGPFSSYPGCDRTVVLMAGPGMELDFGLHGHARFERIYQSHSFAGEWSTTCTLLGGAIRDLNVITRRSALTHALEIHSLEPRVEAAVTSASTLVITALAGDLSVRGADAEIVVRMRETLIVEGGRRTDWPCARGMAAPSSRRFGSSRRAGERYRARSSDDHERALRTLRGARRDAPLVGRPP
jgi:environmental stress-induced protein Ves